MDEMDGEKQKMGDKPLTSLMLAQQKKVLYVEGSPLNFKITTGEDIQLFKALNGSLE